MTGVKTILPEAYLPARVPLSVWRQSGWITLDRRTGFREGCLTEAKGADPRTLPALCTSPCPKRTAHTPIAGKPHTLQVIGGEIYAVSNVDGEDILFRTRGGEWQSLSLGTAHAGVPRRILPYTHSTDPFDTSRDFPMVMLFPDGFYVRPDRDEMQLYKINQWPDTEMPYLSDACAHLSRVFGVGGMFAYASQHNDILRWKFDTEDSVSAAHAWVTASQSGSTTSAADFTAIVPFSGMLLAFKERICQQIGGNKNPFRIADLLAVGTSDKRTVAHVGPYLIFADRHEVYRFDGSDVREIGAPLAAPDLSGAIAATADGLYYLYVPALGRVFTYAYETGAWCELYPFSERPVAAMASVQDGGVLFIDEGGELYATAEAEELPFSIETTPIVPNLPAPSRLLRLRLTFLAEAGAELTVSCRLSDGELVPLCTVTGDGRTQRKSLRIPAAADTAASLCFAGHGKVHVKALDLVTAETAHDGT